MKLEDKRVERRFAMAANTRATRNLLTKEDGQALGAWLRYRVKEIGWTMKDFAEITGIPYMGVLVRIGKLNKGNGRTVPVCLSVDEVKIVAKELGIPALYIFIAFNYPGYSIKSHIKDHDVKAIEAIGKIRNEANHLLRPLGEEKEPRKKQASIKDDPFFDFAKGLEAEETVDIPVAEEAKEEEEPVVEPKIEFVKAEDAITKTKPKIEFVDDEDSETIYVPIHIGAFRKQLREKFTEDVTVKAKFDNEHVIIDISSKKLGISKHYEMTPWEIEATDAELTISALFQRDVMDILFKKEGETVD